MGGRWSPMSLLQLNVSPHYLPLVRVEVWERGKRKGRNTLRPTIPVHIRWAQITRRQRIKQSKRARRRIYRDDLTQGRSLLAQEPAHEILSGGYDSRVEVCPRDEGGSCCVEIWISTNYQPTFPRHQLEGGYTSF